MDDHRRAAARAAHGSPTVRRQFWVPALQDTSDIPERRNRSYRTVARLAPGTTFAARAQEAAAIVRVGKRVTRRVSTRVEQWQRDQGRDARGPLLLLLAAVGLLAAHRVRKRRHPAARRSGRSRARDDDPCRPRRRIGRLVRQLLVESVTIAFAGAVLGAGTGLGDDAAA